MHTLPRSTQRELFTKLYTDHNAELIRYAQRKISDREFAKDLVQEAFLKTWTYLGRGDEIKNMKAFLYRILNNSIVDQYRKQKQKAISLDTLHDAGFEPGVDDSHRLIDRLDGESVVARIQQLPHTYREILGLKYGDDLSVEEIARRCGKSRNNVSVYIHRGLAKLRAEFIIPS